MPPVLWIHIYVCVRMGGVCSEERVFILHKFFEFKFYQYYIVTCYISTYYVLRT